MSGTGGPTNTDWADVRAYNVHTGEPLNCDQAQYNRDGIQERSPWNVQGATGSELIPAPLRPMLPQISGGKEGWAPKPNPDLVEFYRMPEDGTKLPNNSVPTPADNCSNYLEARLNPRQIALVRVPHVAKFASHTPGPNAVYEQPEAGSISYNVYGQLTSTFQAGSPYSYAVGNEDIIQDETGGATFVVWPRTLGPAERRTVFAAARANEWNILQGNTAGPFYSDMMIIRVNGPAPTYQGGLYPSDYRTGAPCAYGPQSTLDPFGLTAVSPDTPFMNVPNGFIATPDILFESTPQGVQCEVDQYLDGTCLRRLVTHINDTGGSYFGSPVDLRVNPAWR